MRYTAGDISDTGVISANGQQGFEASDPNNAEAAETEVEQVDQFYLMVIITTMV